MGATCPDISQFAHTPCGYPSQAQPTPTSTRSGLLLAVHRTCANKVAPQSNRTRSDAALSHSPTLFSLQVDQLVPRMAWQRLRLWKDGGCIAHRMYEEFRPDFLAPLPWSEAQYPFCGRCSNANGSW